MANELDELNTPKMEQGRQTAVLAKQLNVKASGFSKFIRVACWVGVILLGIPTIIYYYKKTKAKQTLQQLQQKLQADASTIDNYMENRVIELQSTASLLSKSIDLDKDVFTQIAALRSGNAKLTDEGRNELATRVESIDKKINIALENYPELKAQQTIADAMQRNSYTQREISACRDKYNDSVLRWNTLIYKFPFYDLIAEENGYTTRIPFAVSNTVKEEARKDFFAN